METRVAGTLSLTFKATYHISIGGALVYAQQGPNSAFVAGATTFYSDGAINTVCDSTSGTPVCHADVKPLTGILSIVRPANALAALEAVVNDRTTVRQSSPSRAVRCLAYTLQNQAVKYCINGQGIVSSMSTPYGNFWLASFTSTVSDADVTAPSS